MRTNCTFMKNGDLRIPANVIKKMGIHNINDLKFIYDEESNELELLKKSDILSIPNDMLEEAGIPLDSNLIAFCRHGEIVVKQDDEDNITEFNKIDSQGGQTDENYIPEYIKAIIATLDENADIKILKLNLK